MGVGYLLEEVVSVFEAEEGYGVGHHPDVAASAVVVRLGPGSVVVAHRQDHVSLSSRVSRRVVSVGVEGWNVYFNVKSHNPPMKLWITIAQRKS